MNDSLNSTNSAGSLSVIKKFGNFKIRQSNQGGVPPMLPDVFVEYSFTEAQKSVNVQGTQVSFKFPKVNEILTEYCQKCLPAICTLAFIDLVNEEIPETSDFGQTAKPIFSVGLPSVSNARLEVALSLYNTVYNQPEISAEARYALSYYLGGTNSLTGLPELKTSASKIAELKDYLKNLETIYTKRLIDEVLPATATDNKGNPIGASVLKWFNEKKGGKILDEEAAKDFIDRANKDMSADAAIRFAENRLRAIMFFADPIISDERFRLSLEDKRWHEYDETIKKEVAFYNQKFNGSPGYVALDWRWVKAMVWTEVMAGPKGDPKEWQARPMRIGVAGDPGFSVLKAGGENTDLIITTEFQNKLQQMKIWDGETNIKAGIAWLFRQACGDQVKWNENKVDAPQILTYTLDNKGFNGIIDKLKTTIENIKVNNPGIDFNNSQAGQIIKYQKAHREKYIAYWLDWETAVKNYNSKEGSGKGDSEYTPKVQRAYQIITSRTK